MQGMHALVDFCMKYPELAKNWHIESNYLCFLATDNEASLDQLADLAERKRIKYVEFMEPDLNNSLTALAFEATDQATELLSNLKLALR